MIFRFKRLLFPTDSDSEALFFYLRLLGVSVAKTKLAATLDEHPNSGTFLSASDAMTSFGVQNIVARFSAEQLEQLEMPFIARMKYGSGLSLAVVKSFGDNRVVYLPPSDKVSQEKQDWTVIDKQKFIEDFDGLVLIGEVRTNAGLPDYSRDIAKETEKFNRTLSALAFFPTLVIVAGAAALMQYGWIIIIPFLYMLLSVFGAVLGTLLLWYEVDKYNPAIRQVCSGGQKLNCDAILNSKSSKIFGVRFSLIGFSYFTGSLLVMLVGGLASFSFFSFLSVFSLIAIGYAVFSIYYQWKIAKAWCKLCLWVQGVLFIQAVLVILDGRLFPFDLIEISILPVLTILTCFAVPFLAGLLVVPIFKRNKDGDNYRRELTRIKHNPQIFQTFLEKQQTVTVSANGLGIVLGNADARHRIIKVCNPYCGPCAKAHPSIEEILYQCSDVQVQIIFTASDDELDFNAPPVRHLLAIAGKNDEVLLKKALDDWYLSSKKDYEAFAQKYPMNGELKAQGRKLTAMHTWCKEMEIRYTPTFYVDGFELPELYSVQDLKYYLLS